MIQLRRNPFSDTSVTISFVEGEKADELVGRALSENGYEVSENVLSHFNLSVNGHLVDREMWPLVAVKEGDTILISPRIARGESGQIFKQFAIITLTVAAFSLLGPGGAYAIANPFGLGVAMAGVTIGATLLLNALIPPPSLDSMGLGGSSQEDSQAYRISGQANTIKKYGNVPRVYGTHRIFPYVAANPYTEIQTDPKSGVLSQYLYGLYDLGYGPLQIGNIRIGDTPFNKFDQATYRLVDFKKPEVEEGDWDKVLNRKLELYYGDVETDGTSYVLDGDANKGGPLAGYQVVRFASDQVHGSDQEIILEFVCPQGLIAYGTDGSTEEREISVSVHFARADEPEGSENWISYDDPNYVSDYKAAGGAKANPYVTEAFVPSNFVFPQISYPRRTSQYYDIDYGVPAGDRALVFASGFREGDIVLVGGVVLGVIQDSVPWPYSTGDFRRYSLTAPVSRPIPMLTVRQYYNGLFTHLLDLRHYDIKKGNAAGFRIRDKSTKPVYGTLSFKPKAQAAYKVRITRQSSTSFRSFRIQDELVLASLTTRFVRSPINTKFRHVFLEISVKATNQLSGALSNLSAEATSILDVYDTVTNTWVKQATSNPAWVFCDLLTGTVNPRPIPKDRLHLPSILEWAQYCDEEIEIYDGRTVARFRCDFILDYNATLHSVVNAVTSAAKASLNIIDGKYGVLLDVRKTVPVQIFTNRNSWGFSSTRSYDDPPHAINVKYIEPTKNWEVLEMPVYEDGYDYNNSEKFEELTAFACTSGQQAWRYGRYMMGQAKLRRETISISVDFEHLVCTRGDFVQFCNDVMKSGGTPARVKSVTGNVVKIDDSLIISPSIDYGYVYRGVDGVRTNTLTPLAPDEFELDGEIPQVGDLIIVGEVGKVVIDCLVRSIEPNDDLSANLILVEKADAIHDLDTGIDIPDYDPQITTELGTSIIPGVVRNLRVVDSAWRVEGKSYQHYINFEWDSPIFGASHESFELHLDSGNGLELIGNTRKKRLEYLVKSEDVGVQHTLAVIAIGPNGDKLTLVDAPTVSATPTAKTTPPANVTGLFMNITAEIMELEWASVNEPDILEYLIRYSPRTDSATWETSIPLLRASNNATSASTQGRTGTYFIKAIDLAGNESSRAAQTRTTIPNLFDLNYIAETNDFPALSGDKVAVATDGEGLMLKRVVSGGVETNQYYPQGYYYYSEFLDLGDIYTVRLQSQIEAEGFTVGDLMANWTTLDTVTSMSKAGNADWDVETQWRSTASFNVMAEWSALENVDPMSEGAQDNWSEWKKFTISDVTGRIFQYRLSLVSHKVDVTPRVYNGVIKSDMPDRTEIYNNLVCPPEGMSVLYLPPFKGPGNSPNIQISQDNAETGDYYILENKTLGGFNITFYDKDSNPVTRQFDAAVRGYGRKALAVI